MPRHYLESITFSWYVCLCHTIKEQFCVYCWMLLFFLKIIADSSFIVNAVSFVSFRVSAQKLKGFVYSSIDYIHQLFLKGFLFQELFHYTDVFMLPLRGSDERSKSKISVFLLPLKISWNDSWAILNITHTFSGCKTRICSHSSAAQVHTRHEQALAAIKARILLQLPQIIQIYSRVEFTSYLFWGF